MQIGGLPDWEATDDSSDTIKLLNMIKSLTHQATDQKYHPLSFYTSIKFIYWLQQGPIMINAHLVEKLKALVAVVE